MEKTYIPCTRDLQVLDSQSGQVSPFYDYKVLREAVAGLGESISVRIEEENGTEKVYVGGVFEPVASMLPGQVEDDEMLLGLFQGWAPPTVTWNLKVEKKVNHYALTPNTDRCPGSVICYSKSLTYVKSRIRKFAETGNVKVEWFI